MMFPDTLGRSLRDLRISVTDRCNLRCPYCMPAEEGGHRYNFLPHAEILSFEEIARLARLMFRLGARKIRLTGGEPLLRKDLPALVALLTRIDGIEDVALTTNGLLLERDAAALAHAGLSRVTVSLDSLDEETFRQLSGDRGSLAPVLAGIAAAERAGLSPLKINTVVVRGVNEEDIHRIAVRFRGTGHIVRFIEFMDVGTLNAWSLERVVPAAEIFARIDAEFPLAPVDPEYRGEVARRYRYKDGAGEIGIISSVTQPFCGDCTRARLTADGRLITCLFATAGVDLKRPIRAGATDERLMEIIEETWRRRDDRYSELRAARHAEAQDRIEMFRVGG